MSDIPLTELIDPGNLGGFAAQAIARGYSGNQALQALREAGAGVRRQEFYRTWGEVKAGIAAHEAVAAAPLHEPPAYDIMTPWSVKNPHGYVYKVGVITKDEETGVRITHFYTVPTEQLITKYEAESRAFQDFADHAAEYGEIVLGTYTHSIWQQVPTLEV